MQAPAELRAGERGAFVAAAGWGCTRPGDSCARLLTFDAASVGIDRFDFSRHIADLHLPINPAGLVARPIHDGRLVRRSADASRGIGQVNMPLGSAPDHLVDLHRCFSQFPEWRAFTDRDAPCGSSGAMHWAVRVPGALPIHTCCLSAIPVECKPFQAGDSCSWIDPPPSAETASGPLRRGHQEAIAQIRGRIVRVVGLHSCLSCEVDESCGQPAFTEPQTCHRGPVPSTASARVRDPCLKTTCLRSL